MKLKEVRQGEGAVVRLLNSKLNSKAAYRLAKILRTIKGELQIIEDRRQALVKEFGKEEKMNVFTVLPENTDAYYKAFEDFLETEAEIPVQPITLAMLEGVELTPGDLIDLGQFFSEEES